MSAHLEMLARILVLVRRADNAVYVLLSRERNRANHSCARNVVTAVKNEETDGYKAVQLGYGQVDPRKVTKPMQGHFAKSTIPPLGPGMAPLMAMTPFSTSEETTVRFSTVLVAWPMRPAMRLPLRIRLGVAHAQVVVAQLAAARQGTHAVKNRAKVSGGGRKPWKQKGTGRARQGSIRAPQWYHGGVHIGQGVALLRDNGLEDDVMSWLVNCDHENQAALVRARSALRSGTTAALCTARSRVTTASAPPRR